LLGLSWVEDDAGHLFPPEKVFGRSALQYFGRRRGYWSSGYERFPELCRLFEIGKEISEQDIQDYLLEIG